MYNGLAITEELISNEKIMSNSDLFEKNKKEKRDKFCQ